MQNSRKFAVMIMAAVGLLLMVGGTVLVLHLGDHFRAGSDLEEKSGNSWFNGSRYIEENWAYIDLTFPPGYEGMKWDVAVFGIGGEGRTYIYSMDSEVNSSVNGVRLNLNHDQIRRYECFDIRVTVRDENQTEPVCLDTFEVR